jgi:hypothetical protein
MSNCNVEITDEIMPFSFPCQSTQLSGGLAFYFSATVILLEISPRTVIGIQQSNSAPKFEPIQEERFEPNQFHGMPTFQFVTISIPIQIPPKKVICTKKNMTDSRH